MREVDYTQEDVMQALCAALLWGEDGIDRQARADSDRDARRGLPVPERVSVSPGAMTHVIMSAPARELLGMASERAEDYERYELPPSNGIVRFDLGLAS